jgi:hypothetical protein
MEEHASIPDATGSRDLGLGLHNSEPFLHRTLANLFD